MTTEAALPAIEHPRIALGSMLVSLLEPVRGHEADLHRWYERDHFLAGCMVGPGFFAGRRYVATRALKDLRFPAQTPIIEDIARGSYLALYYLLAGRHEETVDWAVERVNWLNANDRMLKQRIQAHAGFYHHRFRVERDPDGVPAELALEHPYPAVVLLMIDRASGTEAGELQQAHGEYVATLMRDSPLAQCIGFEPEPLPDDAPSYVIRPPGLERRSLQLFFLDEVPTAANGLWQEAFVSQDQWLRDQGLGAVSYAAPFIPTLPGSDRYADQLW